jgi:S1-C subfamily serine protease
VAPSPASPHAVTLVIPDFAGVAARLNPSVVTVLSSVRSRDATAKGSVRGLGSGVIVSAKGQILTNEHVIAGATTIEVELATQESVPARTILADPLLDLALLELDVAVAGLQPVEFASTSATVGQWVMAIGQPFGLGNTVTVGVVGGLGRDYDDLGRPQGLRKDGIFSFIQTDASVNIGNSGGPLVDADGRVIGITTATRLDGQGLGFAIPTQMVRRFLEEAWTHGRVRHARLGIRAEDDYGAVPGRTQVVRITKVEPGGPAAKAGLEPGDAILAIGGVRLHRVSEVAYRTQIAGVGARVTATIQRGQEVPRDVLLVPAELAP